MRASACIDEALGVAVAAAGIAGAVAFVGDGDGLRYSGSFGLRDIASAAPMTADTVFQLASMTKAVTSIAAMQLVEQGKLGLDAPVGALLPGLDRAQVITGFDGDGVVTLRPARRPITLRHLLTHTSGLGYDFLHADQARARGANPPASASLAAIHTPLLFDPGERWAYGLSTDWVGLAIEAASGQKLDRYFADHIFAPLGMADTAFLLSSEQRARQAMMYARGADGRLSPFPISLGGGAAAEFFAGGGGLSGSGGDYMRFLRMLLNGGSFDGATIVRPETFAEMARNHVGALRAGVMEGTTPTFSHAIDWFPDMTPGWGLGFMINPQAGPDGRAANSLAWAGIANTYYWIDRESGIAALLLMQFLPFADPQALGLLAAFERAVYAA